MGFYVDAAAIMTGRMVTRFYSPSSELIHVGRTKLTNSHSHSLALVKESERLQPMENLIFHTHFFRGGNTISHPAGKISIYEYF